MQTIAGVEVAVKKLGGQVMVIASGIAFARVKDTVTTGLFMP